jgi:hypothetical protein
MMQIPHYGRFLEVAEVVLKVLSSTEKNRRLIFAEDVVMVLVERDEAFSRG